MWRTRGRPGVSSERKRNSFPRSRSGWTRCSSHTSHHRRIADDAVTQVRTRWHTAGRPRQLHSFVSSDGSGSQFMKGGFSALPQSSRWEDFMPVQLSGAHSSLAYLDRSSLWQAIPAAWRLPPAPASWVWIVGTSCRHHRLGHRAAQLEWTSLAWLSTNRVHWNSI